MEQINREYHAAEMLKAMLRCPGIDSTDQETGETFRTLVNSALGIKNGKYEIREAGTNRELMLWGHRGNVDAWWDVHGSDYEAAEEEIHEDGTTTYYVQERA